MMGQRNVEQECEGGGESKACSKYRDEEQKKQRSQQSRQSQRSQQGQQSQQRWQSQQSQQSQDSRWRRGAGRGLRQGMDTVLVAANVGLFAFMVVIGTYQILVRYLFNRPSTVSEELLTYTFAWLSLLAAAYMFGKRGHMRMGFLADQLTGTAKRWLEAGIEILAVAFAAIVMVYGGIQITSLTMTQKTASLGIPMGYVYSIVPISGILILVYCGMNLAELVMNRSSAESQDTIVKNAAQQSERIQESGNKRAVNSEAVNPEKGGKRS